MSSSTLPEVSAGFLDAAVQLLSIPSTADRPAELGRVLDWMIEFVGPGFVVERFFAAGKPSALLYHHPASPSLSAAGPARPHFRIILNGHLDVVPAEPDQFVPRLAGQRLYARGAQDMKLSALVMAEVFRELAPRLPYPIALQLVTDEEIGGRNGTKLQVDSGVRGDFVILGEQSRLDIVIESKGLVDVTLTATGRAGHGAYPWLGDNALVEVLGAVSALLERYPMPAEEVWRTTVNVAKIETPNAAFNQIPAAASAWLNIRFPPTDPDFTGRTPEQVAEYLGRVCGPAVTVHTHQLDPPHLAERERPEIVLLRRAAQAEGYQGAFLRKHGAFDGRYFYQSGSAAVAFGIGGDGQHGPEEYADLSTVPAYRAALTTMLRELAGLDKG